MNSPAIHVTKPQEIAPFAVDARTAARLLAISERSLFDLVQRGEIRCRKLGVKRIFPLDELRRWLIAEPSATNAADSPDDPAPSDSTQSDAASSDSVE